MITTGPQRQGLYDPSMEKDSCGVGAVADIKGQATHDIVEKGLTILKNMKHRGAVGADATTGDGAGIMTQIPHRFFSSELAKVNINLPELGDYAVGCIFLPRVPQARLYCEGVLESVLKEEGLKMIGWRDVPVDVFECGHSARATRPDGAQIFIDRSSLDPVSFERKLLIVRKRTEKLVRESNMLYTDTFYICNLSSKTVIYKGQILGYKLDSYYPDLKNEAYQSAMAIVHERYSTNTFPSWKLAQPFRYLAHNGEINTIRGNVNWMNAREGVLRSGIFGSDFHKILPIIEPGGSDSASLDNALELFMANGHGLAYSLMLMIPEPWQNDKQMSESMRGFYEYHARIMEPWDGPAALVCSNGDQIAAKLDRNGLRPARYGITKSGKIVIASETGVVDFEKDPYISKAALEPGKILFIDMLEGRVIPDQEIKNQLSDRKPFAEWVSKNRLTLKDIKGEHEVKRSRIETRSVKEKVFGYSKKEITTVLSYMAQNGKEPIGSMGIDEPMAILSKEPNLLFDYFRQAFAQVTNPPIDPFRERSVVSLRQFIGSHGRLLDEIETETDNKYLMIKSPVLSSAELEDIRHLDRKGLANAEFKAVTIPALFHSDQENGLKLALDKLCSRAEELVKNGHNILVISDRGVNYYNAPIPSLLALSAVHQHLIRKKLRTATDIVMETGEARDVMHIALLIGFGAKAVNPYLVYELLTDQSKDESGFNAYKEGIAEGVLKIISRMGISTLPSYNGAQIFEAVGIHQSVIEPYFTDTPSRVGGMDIDQIEKDVLMRHKAAYVLEQSAKEETKKESTSNQSRDKMFDKEIVSKLHEACRTGDEAVYRSYAELTSTQKVAIRDHLEIHGESTISIEQVESVESILKRFTISGMSFGSLSKEAHETIAVAMNRLGATSNSGEGGEDPKRFKRSANGNQKCSAVKQIASGRFGVTAEYLVNCDEIQIKMAQGAKPGEGGHLPGSKVTVDIAKTRYAQPGRDLISPPPHHDIYSIEDLAQLIFDMKNINPKARVGVKLVASHGVGTVAAGVAKAFADVIKISGSDGGTGASPVSSMKYVGLPWEMGLAEAQQTLLLNDLRKRVRLQVDGKLRNGRDVVIGALIGAEEFGFGTLAMLSVGCIMCRQCHKGQCPVGIATQDPAKRKKFTGKPEHLVNLMRNIAQEVRGHMAELGFENMDDMVGRVDLLKPPSAASGYAGTFDFSPILHKPTLPTRIHGRCVEAQIHKIDDVLDKKVIEAIESSSDDGPHKVELDIKNTDRSFGAMTSGYLVRENKSAQVDITAKGSAGQSFAAFAKEGMKLHLIGECNDYLGKGLCGGIISIKPAQTENYVSQENAIIGNTSLYGATSGEAYIAGRAGQRFAVRNSGVNAVVEGIGNHGCEYMTGGEVLILGSVGQNFAAGMTGGCAYVLDENNSLKNNVNMTHVNLVEVLEKTDLESIKLMLNKHVDMTGSDWGRILIKDWSVYKGLFRKVQPKMQTNQ